MKIVVLNGSPRKGGNTEIMTQAFTKGAEKKGHEVVNLPVGTMKIRGCMACEYCFSHNGECAQKDDMTQVYAELKDADMVVFASPIYWFDITAQLKAVIDRLYVGATAGFHFHKPVCLECLKISIPVVMERSVICLGHVTFASLIDAGADHVFDAAIEQYRATAAYVKWENCGIITVPNMESKGSMSTCPKLTEVEALGESL